MKYIQVPEALIRKLLNSEIDSLSPNQPYIPVAKTVLGEFEELLPKETGSHEGTATGVQL